MFKKVRLLFWYAVTLTLVSGCAGEQTKVCSQPELSASQVSKIAEDFLSGQDMNPEFMAVAQSRVTADGCDYVYELAEELDSLGIEIFVQVSREGEAVGFHGHPF